MKRISMFILLFSVFLLGSCSDIYTKNWAKKSLAENRSIVILNNYLELQYHENYSMGFNLLSNINEQFRKPFLFLLPISVIIFLLIYIYKMKNYSFLFLLPFIVILSGAAGNLIDRFRYGYVIDFIYFHISDKFNWPIFNIADVLICIGAGLLLIEIFAHRKILE